MSNNNDKSSPNKEASPLTGETLFAITELAMLGHAALKHDLQSGKLQTLDTDPAKDAAMRRHYQILVEKAGPQAIGTFVRLCNYAAATEREQEQTKENEQEKGKEPDHA